MQGMGILHLESLLLNIFVLRGEEWGKDAAIRYRAAPKWEN